jgi:ADP-ribose pyrophosphatase YjhB (NUDIX family)
MQNQNWKQTTEAVPRTAVQVIVVDRQGRTFLLHRSAKVRSARNCWSLPSGLHDIGETIEECGKREVEEEFGLKVLDFTRAGIYENIAGDHENPEADQWHWVIILAIGVVDAHVNNEPDKHDQVAYVHVDDFGTPQFFDKYNFHPSFVDYMSHHAHEFRTAIEAAISIL